VLGFGFVPLSRELSASVVEVSLFSTALTGLRLLVDGMALQNVGVDEVTREVEILDVLFVDIAVVVGVLVLRLILNLCIVPSSFTSLICSYGHLTGGTGLVRAAAFCDRSASLLP
jgi:hypothetical protein